MTTETQTVQTETPSAAPESVTSVTPEDTTAPETDAPEGEEAPAGDVDGELKTVRKALDKRNRYINNQRNRIRALEAELNKIKDGFSKEKTSAPTLDQFESVVDYLKADGNYTIENKLAEQAHNAKLAALEQQKQMAYEAQAQDVAVQVQELLTSNSDFKAVISENVQVIQSMPEHIENMLLEMDNSPAATYALAKEGMLESLYHMPAHLAAAHLVQAEIRGVQYLQQAAKPQSQSQQQAPKPIGSLKGSGKSSKSLSDMSPDELVKRYIK